MGGLSKQSSVPGSCRGGDLGEGVRQKKVLGGEGYI